MAVSMLLASTFAGIPVVLFQWYTPFSTNDVCMMVQFDAGEGYAKTQYTILLTGVLNMFCAVSIMVVNALTLAI